MHKSLLSTAFALSILFSATTVHAQTGAAESSAPARAVASSAPARQGATSSDSGAAADVMMEEEQDSGVNTAVGDIDGDSTGNTDAGADFYLELDGVEGESSDEKAPGVEPDEIDNKMTDEEAEKKKGNVEYDWKVEEGQKMEEEGDGFDEVAVEEESEPVMPDFSILLGGGGAEDDGSSENEEEWTEVEELILNGMKEEGTPAETLSLNYEEIKFTAKQSVKLFGFISVPATATVEFDAESKVKVKFPWWAFLASGKDGDTLGEQITAALSNVLKNKHDTVKSIIGNIKA